MAAQRYFLCAIRPHREPQIAAAKQRLRQCIFAPPNADVAKLVDALDLGSSAVRRGGSIPFIRTKKKPGLRSRAF